MVAAVKKEAVNGREAADEEPAFQPGVQGRSSREYAGQGVVVGVNMNRGGTNSRSGATTVSVVYSESSARSEPVRIDDVCPEK